MLIISLEGVAFTTLALLVYHLLPPRTQPYWLLLTSYVFYALTAWRFVPILAFVTLATFVVARRLAPGGQRRRLWLWTGVVAIVATVGSLRFAYATDPFAGAFAVMGLSFYSLQALSYLFDTYAGTIRPTSLADLALYLAYFPKLVAGPIERARRFLPQLAGRRGAR